VAPVQISAERVIPAPAAAVYALLADYRTGHPSILPPAFSNFAVLEGGTGAGTRIRFTLTLVGRANTAEGVVSEPEPGRVLAETYPDNGSVTTFTVEPAGDGRCHLAITTSWTTRRGLTGLVERLVVPRLLVPLYREELDLIEQWAESR
jgi:hypothetical protein